MAINRTVFLPAGLMLVLTFFAVPALFGQDIPASAATAEGYEGLLYNPAALAVYDYQALGFGWIFSAPDSYSLTGALGDGLRMQYWKEEGSQGLELLYGFGFPLYYPFYAGVSVGADLFDFSWRDLDLATGLLFYPHRYLAVAAAQQHLLDPDGRSYTFGVGLRPFTERVTLFGDLIFSHDFDPADLDAAVGFRTEPLDGVNLGFRTSNRFRDFILGVSLQANNLNLDFSVAGDYEFSSYRVGAGLRYDLLPARSLLHFGPEAYRLTLSKPLSRDSTKKNSLYNLDSLVTRIYQLAEDRDCDTLVLEFDSSVILSVDILEELYAAFSYFKSKGKRIITYLDFSFSELDYLAAAAGSTVVASPYSLVPLVGVGSRLIFFKNLFDELGIEVEYARSSEYKAYLDRFLRAELSEENRRQIEAYLEVSYELILDILVSCRGLSRERARELVDGGPYWSSQAAELGLVDEVLYEQDFEDKYLEELGPHRLVYLEYQAKRWRQPEIAVVKASGMIVASQVVSPWDRLIGQVYITEKNLIPVLDRLAEEPSVAAVVLQIDSGGGDGLVSDKIWKAIMELREEKPVVVVVGRVAASGGYYLAMTGEKVFAWNTALTGSIGSFSFKLVIRKLLERYGITTDSVQFGENYDMFSPLAEMSEQQRDKLGDLNERFTERFYGKVAAARSLSYEQVEELGGGRIYSGQQARKLDLIDEIGGVRQALAYLEKELRLEAGEYRLHYYPDRAMLFALLLKELSESGYSLESLARRLLLLP